MIEYWLTRLILVIIIILFEVVRNGKILILQQS